jgi:hypothetical protein
LYHKTIIHNKTTFVQKKPYYVDLSYLLKRGLHRKTILKGLKKFQERNRKNNRSILKFVKPTISVLGTFCSGKEINRIYDNLAYVTLITQCWYEFV